MAEKSMFSKFENCKINFQTSDGIFEGYVTVVNDSYGRMTVRNCVYLPDNIHMGTLFVPFKEVSEISLVPISSHFSERNPRALNSKGNKPVPDQEGAKSLKMVIDDSTVPASFSHLPSKLFIIQSFADEWKMALEDLRASSVIGVSLEGPMLGRYGIISWLCVSTRCGTYFFDLQILGKEVFNHGLREIFERKNIEKVIHDCRQVSDTLFHLFDTKLENIFDTQTADAFVNLQTNRDFNGYVNPLDWCLQTYLNIPKEFLPQPEQFPSYLSKVKSYLVRPLGDFQKRIMITNVIYLISLKEELRHRMLKPFHAAVNTYLEVVKSKSDLELRLKPHNPHHFPEEILVDQKWGVVEYKETPHVPVNEAFNLPYTGQYSFVNKLNEQRKQYLHIQSNSRNSHVPKSVRSACAVNDKSISCTGVPAPNGVRSISDFSGCSSVLERKQSESAKNEKKSTISDTLEEKVIPTGAKVLPIGISKVLQILNSNKGLKSNSCSAEKTNLAPKDPVSVNENIDCYLGFSDSCNESDSELNSFQVSQDEESTDSSDPWAALRAEFSQYQDPVGSNPSLKHRLIPAGK